jgi:Flp pilus assembly protein TadD
MLREANESYPNDPGTLSLLADAYLGGGDHEAGIEWFRRVIELDPDNFYAHYQLGMVFLSENQLAAARQSIQHASQIAPGDARAIEALEMIHALESDGD